MRRKYKGALAIAAAFLLGVIVTPVAMKLMNGKEMLSAASSGIEDKAVKQDETSKAEVKDENISKKTTEGVPDVASSDEKVIDSVKMSSNVNFIDLYSKTEVSMDKKLTFNTPFIATADGRYKASIEGKGENAIEEGIGILYIKDTSTNKMYEYTATDKVSNHHYQ